jgi:hypothetical protein
MKFCAYRIFLVLLVFAFVPAAHAEVWVCESPQGARYANSFGLFEEINPDLAPGWSDDGFTGITPIFRLPEQGSRELQIFWGSTRPDGLPNEIIPTTEWETAIITARSPTYIFSVQIDDAVLWTYALFSESTPKLIATRYNSGGAGQHFSYYMADCEVSM